MSSAAVTLVCPDAPHFEVDGELHHARSGTVVVRCLPGALRAIAG
jgi:diacylglycerol kinase family enzyme